MQSFLIRRILPLILLGTLTLGASCVRREGAPRVHRHERRPGPPPGPRRAPGYGY